MICHKCKFYTLEADIGGVCDFGAKGKVLGSFDGIAPEWCPIRAILARHKIDPVELGARCRCLTFCDCGETDPAELGKQEGDP